MCPIPETVTVTRTCIKKPGAKDGCKRWETDGGYMIWCICSNHDNCNGGGTTAASVTLVAWTLAAVAVLRMIL
jgi:hypothetical protein